METPVPLPNTEVKQFTLNASSAQQVQNIQAVLFIFMKKEFSKTQIKKDVEGFFKEIKSKNPKEIKKIKTLAMSYKIPLKEERKLFCKKCFTPYKNPKIRIKNNAKSIECENCRFVSRWKLD